MIPRPNPICIVCALLLAIGVSSSRAQPAPSNDAARIHYEQGKTLAGNGNYAAAYFEFESGYRLDPRPAFLFNMGEAARGMGDVAKARAAFEHYLALEPTGALADTARKRLAEFATTPQPVATGAAPVGQTEPAKPPVPKASVVLPPPHEVTPSMQTRGPSDMFVQHPPVTEERPLWKKWPFWAAVGGVVVAGVVVGAVATRGHGPTCDVGCIDLR